MPAVFEAPAAQFLADFGVDLVGPGAVGFRALLDQPDELLGLGDVNAVSRQYAATFASADITLARGDTVTQGATSYTVREKPRQIGDGAFSQALLSKV